MASPFDSRYSNIVSRIRYYANTYGIPENIGIWQIWYESQFNPRAQSPAGARGIAQFMPATATRFGVNVWDIESSLNGWGKYMSWLLRQPYINGNIELALGGYNAGEGRIQQYRGLPPFRETQEYVKKIMRAAGSSPVVTPIVNQQPSGHEDYYSGYVTTSTPIDSTDNSDTALWLGLGFLALILFA